MPAKHAKPQRGEATKEERKRQDAEPRSETRGVRRLVERQRETFNQLAKSALGRGCPDPGRGHLGLDPKTAIWGRNRRDPPVSDGIAGAGSAGRLS